MLLPAPKDFSLFFYITASIGISFLKPASCSPLMIPFLPLFLIHAVFFNSSGCPFDITFLHKHCLSALTVVQSPLGSLNITCPLKSDSLVSLPSTKMSVLTVVTCTEVSWGRSKKKTIVFPAFGIVLRTWISSAVHHHLKMTSRRIGFPGLPSLTAQVKIAFNFNFLPFDGSTPVKSIWTQIVFLVFRLPPNLCWPVTD